MSEFKNKHPEPPKSQLAAYSKQAYDSPSHQNALKQYERDLEHYNRDKERAVELQQRATEKEAERKEREKEKEIERLEKERQRNSDRWFTAILLILGAVIGVLLTKMADFIFK